MCGGQLAIAHAVRIFASWFPPPMLSGTPTTDDPMRFSFRLAELVNYQPDPKKRPASSKLFANIRAWIAIKSRHYCEMK